MSYEICPYCDGEVVLKHGRYGEYYGCTKCSYTRNVVKDRGYGRCPECGYPLRLVEGEYGDFLGCTNYPECRYTERY